ncbi:hypothetical protein KIN20_035602 [Parelaphostrongylus tenuis]|uniref:FAD-binding PCMH-type domain-containing protein n=1 Tax=Parelaphostrongylus tenuis TaxID=148309 RepID=A0AAD5RBN4_PARTN|nr:hypothetical protein KIN20_035602 [Parelaphostrongylus tenuis]
MTRDEERWLRWLEILDLPTIDSTDIRIFESICGSNYVKTEDIDNYTIDWTKAFKGNAACVLLPCTTEEVSALLAHCARRKIAVVPQAGNTGLAGGGVPVHDEVVISVERIKQHFSFDEETGLLFCSVKKSVPSAITHHIQVLPTEEGTVVELGSALRKDNTSLHTPHLFLGSEGQLGLITRVTMSTVPKPTSIQSAMIERRAVGDVYSVQLNEVHEANPFFMNNVFLRLIGDHYFNRYCLSGSTFVLPWLTDAVM